MLEISQDYLKANFAELVLLHCLCLRLDLAAALKVVNLCNLLTYSVKKVQHKGHRVF